MQGFSKEATIFFLATMLDFSFGPMEVVTPQQLFLLRWEGLIWRWRLRVLMMSNCGGFNDHFLLSNRWEITPLEVEIELVSNYQVNLSYKEANLLQFSVMDQIVSIEVGCLVLLVVLIIVVSIHLVMIIFLDSLVSSMSNWFANAWMMQVGSLCN